MHTSDWSTALAYCDGLSWGGSSDWRLPSDYELRTLARYQSDGNRWDRTAFVGWSWTSDEGGFWTSAFEWTGPRVILFTAPGTIDDFITTSTLPRYTRCVRIARRTLTPTLPRFTRTEPVAGEPVVADATTGRAWQGCDAGFSGSTCTGVENTYTWSAASSFCSTLTWGGLTGWHLPSLEELRSIYNPQYSTVDATAFPNTPGLIHWTSQDAYTLGLAYHVRFDYRATGSTPKTTALLVRCVR